MKKLLSLIFAGSISLFLAGWALSQVPASLVRSGIVIGTASGQGSASIVGTAVFNPSSGSISGLVTTGIISGVSYSGVGSYAVTITGSPSNYLVIVSGADDTRLVVGQILPVASYTSSGFTASVGDNSTRFDPPVCFVTVIH
jgi:hypothetical protein